MRETERTRRSEPAWRMARIQNANPSIESRTNASWSAKLQMLFVMWAGMKAISQAATTPPAGRPVLLRHHGDRDDHECTEDSRHQVHSDPHAILGTEEGFEEHPHDCEGPRNNGGRGLMPPSGYARSAS